jgi:hypothetical protein
MNEYNHGYLAKTYYKEERKAVAEVLYGKYEKQVADQEEKYVKVEDGAIDKIKEAMSSEEIGTIVEGAALDIDKVKTKPVVVSEAIDKLNTDYPEITTQTICDRAREDVAPVYKKYIHLLRAQKEEVTNFDLLTSLWNKINAFGITKENAIATLEAYKNIENKVDYYDAEWEAVKKAVDDGIAAVDAAGAEEVSAALAEALDEIYAIQTKVDVVSEKIEKCVDNYLDNLSEENIADARKDVAAARDAFNELTEGQQEEINSIVDDVVRDAAAEHGVSPVYLMDRFEALEDQVAGYELKKAQEDAVAELEAYYDYEDAYFNNWEVYDHNEWAEVVEAIRAGIEAIGNAETVENVDAALLAAEENIEKVLTKPEAVSQDIADLADYYGKEGKVDDIVIDGAKEARDLYDNALTTEEQAAVTNLIVLERIEAAIETARETAVDYVESKIEAINNLDDVVEGRNIVFEAADAYSAAVEEVKALVSNADVLKDAMAEIQEEWPARISEKIKTLYATWTTNGFATLVNPEEPYGELNPEPKEVTDFKDEVEAVYDEFVEYYGPDKQVGGVVDKYADDFGFNNRIVKEYRNWITEMHDAINPQP